MKYDKLKVDSKNTLITQQQLDLGYLIELTDLMLKGALEQQWDSVREQQIHRDELLRVFFEEKIEIEDRVVAKEVQYMIDSDQKLIGLGQEEKSTLHEKIQKVRQGKSAVKAYTIG